MLTSAYKGYFGDLDYPGLVGFGVFTHVRNCHAQRFMIPNLFILDAKAVGILSSDSIHYHGCHRRPNWSPLQQPVCTHSKIQSTVSAEETFPQTMEVGTVFLLLDPPLDQVCSILSMQNDRRPSDNNSYNLIGLHVLHVSVHLCPSQPGCLSHAGTIIQLLGIYNNLEYRKI